MKDRKKKKIVLIGTNGQYNLGDDILLEVFLEQLGREHSYVVNSYDPGVIVGMYGDKYDIVSFHTTKDILRLPVILWKSDVVIFTGGSILKELYNYPGRMMYSSLLIIFGVVFLAKVLFRKTVIMSNIGVGPLKTSLGEKIAKWILLMVDRVTVRDLRSSQLCKRLLSRDDSLKSIVSPDAVFAFSEDMDDEEEYRLSDSCGKASQKCKRKGNVDDFCVGLNLNFNIENPDNWDYFTTTLRSSILDIAQKHTISLLGIPMQRSFNSENDVVTLTKFRKSLEKENIPFNIGVPASAKELYQLIDRCDIVLAERFHTILFCALRRKLFIPLCYDTKVHGLVELLGMDAYKVDINVRFHPQLISSLFEECFRNSEYIRSILDKKVLFLSKQVRDDFSVLRKIIAQS